MTDENTMIDIARNSAAIAVWSDDKKKDYVKLFKQRANASMYILRNTAKDLAQTALEKHFMGRPKYNQLMQDCNNYADEARYGDNFLKHHGRTASDLDSVIKQRVKELISNLPTVKAAMEILDPDTVERMIRVEELEKQGQELHDEFEELCEDIKMSDLDQNMTIGAFRAMVKELEAKRKNLLEQIDEISKEGQELQTKIDKALFKGLPGISDEIASVVKQLYAQSIDLSTTCRDVENVVLYGDNEAALKILETFKDDDRKITTDIGKRFQNGLELLKLRVNGKKVIAKTSTKAKAVVADTDNKDDKDA